MNSKKVYIGVDLGGTNIACGAVNEQMQLICKASTPTKLPRTIEEVCADIAVLCRKVAEQAGIPFDQIEGIGIGSPGTVNAETGMLEYSNNFNWENLPLRRVMQEATGCQRIALGNDANAAALGEFVAGAAKGCQSAVMVTLGTGVGGGIIVDGKLLTGHNYAGAELGHMVIQADGLPCNCGRRGCLEVYCSATAIKRMSREAMQAHPETLMWKLCPNLDQVSGKTVFSAAEQGDAVAQGVVDAYLYYLACGLCNVINIFQPQVLTLGGGVSNEGQKLIDKLEEIMDPMQYVHDKNKRTKLKIATLGNDAGIIGAAALLLQ